MHPMSAKHEYERLSGIFQGYSTVRSNDSSQEARIYRIREMYEAPAGRFTVHEHPRTEQIDRVRSRVRE